MRDLSYLTVEEMMIDRDACWKEIYILRGATVIGFGSRAVAEARIKDNWTMIDVIDEELKRRDAQTVSRG